MIKCDICGCSLESTQAYTLHAPVMSVVRPGCEVGWLSPDNWAACLPCYTRILRRDYEPLLAHVMGALNVPISTPDDEVGFLRSLLVTMWDNLNAVQ